MLMIMIILITLVKSIDEGHPSNPRLTLFIIDSFIPCFFCLFVMKYWTIFPAAFCDDQVTLRCSLTFVDLFFGGGTLGFRWIWVLDSLCVQWCAVGNFEFLLAASYREGPGPSIRYHWETSLKEMVTSAKVKQPKKLFYQRLTMAITELESKRQFKCTWVDARLKVIILISAFHFSPPNLNH